LTEAQVAALEKAKADKEAHGDTFYVGTLNGVGRIYPVDTDAKVGFVSATIARRR